MSRSRYTVTRLTTASQYSVTPLFSAFQESEPPLSNGAYVQLLQLFCGMLCLFLSTGGSIIFTGCGNGNKAARSFEIK